MGHGGKILRVLRLEVSEWISDTTFSTSGFIHDTVSPTPPSIPLEPFWIFSKIRGDIRELLFITGVNDTGNKLFSGVNDTGKKFIAGVVDTGD